VILCHCNGVSDRAIRRAVRRGAETVAEVGEHCGAGTTCGACHPSIEALLAESRHVAPALGTVA
jgi:bacterioferritin-associated ferredoxin